MQTPSRFVPAADGHGEHEDRGSRFLAVVFRAQDESAFLNRLEDVKREHPKARHWCWAWKIGEAYRFSDDGEPGGTAGRPMLQVLEGSGMDEVAAISVRYFGGVKLGTGGLARAYGGSTARAMEATTRLELVPRVALKLSLPFDLLGLRDELSAHFPSSTFVGEYTDSGWEGIVHLDESEWERFQVSAQDRSSGRVTIHKLEE